jgi:hypothetical protein
VLRAGAHDYARLGKHHSGWIAQRLGTSLAEEARCVAALAGARRIQQRGDIWIINQTQTIDTRADAARGSKLKAEWLKVALSRLESGVSGAFGYNLMAISRADLTRLREMHVAYFRDMQSLDADSAPSECVVLFNADLFALDAPAPQHSALCAQSPT